MAINKVNLFNISPPLGMKLLKPYLSYKRRIQSECCQLLIMYIELKMLSKYPGQNVDKHFFGFQEN
jgi:hypothetical protein